MSKTPQLQKDREASLTSSPPPSLKTKTEIKKTNASSPQILSLYEIPTKPALLQIRKQEVGYKRKKEKKLEHIQIINLVLIWLK